MQITLTPQRRDDAMTYSHEGEVLTVNGVEFDLSPLEEGDTLYGDAFATPFIARASRREGEVLVTLIEPQGPPNAD
jgi:hypothetical protein